jgi:hypothetical protein
MLALRELQMCFTAALLDGAVAGARAHRAIVTDGLAAHDRLGIYRNNVREGFIKALAVAFPVIERLVGPEYFRQLAIEFQAKRPSRSGDLHHIGQAFAAFLQLRFRGTGYAYLPDVADLEWAWQEAQLAADREALTREAFAAAAASAALESLRLELHPACSLVQSEFPVTRIWLANQPDADPGEVIDLAAGGDHIVLRRTAADIEFVRLSAGEFAALESLAGGETLADAYESALEADPHFDLPAALCRFVTLQLFVGLRVPAATPEDIRS